MRVRYLVFKIKDNDVKNGIEIAEKFGGKAGKIAWKTGSQYIKDKAILKVAEHRLKRILNKMEDRYMVSYDQETSQYVVEVVEPEVIESVE